MTSPAFAASVWINDQFISTVSPGTSSDRINSLFTFPAGSVKLGKDNVITVVQVRNSTSTSLSCSHIH